jgi:hypothetical protein
MKVKVYKSQNELTKCYTIFSIVVIYGWSAGSFCAAGGAGVVTANGVPTETEPRECPNLTQLQLEGQRIAALVKLQRLQPCKTGAVMQKEPVGEINPGLSGRTFFSKYTTIDRSFAAALCSSEQHISNNLHNNSNSLQDTTQQVTSQSSLSSVNAG